MANWIVFVTPIGCFCMSADSHEGADINYLIINLKIRLKNEDG